MNAPYYVHLYTGRGPGTFVGPFNGAPCRPRIVLPGGALLMVDDGTMNRANPTGR